MAETWEQLRNRIQAPGYPGSAPSNPVAPTPTRMGPTGAGLPDISARQRAPIQAPRLPDPPGIAAFPATRPQAPQRYQERQAARQQTPVYGPETESDAVQRILRENANVPFVQRIMNPGKVAPLKNPDGSISTHSMAWDGDPVKGPAYVYPTVEDYTGKGLQRYEGIDAIKRAIQANNVIKFDDPSQAQWFAEGGYKRAWDGRSDDPRQAGMPPRPTRGNPARQAPGFMDQWREMAQGSATAGLNRERDARLLAPRQTGVETGVSPVAFRHSQNTGGLTGAPPMSPTPNLVQRWADRQATSGRQVFPNTIAAGTDMLYNTHQAPDFSSKVGAVGTLGGLGVDAINMGAAAVQPFGRAAWTLATGESAPKVDFMQRGLLGVNGDLQSSSAPKLPTANLNGQERVFADAASRDRALANPQPNPSQARGAGLTAGDVRDIPPVSAPVNQPPAVPARGLEAVQPPAPNERSPLDQAGVVQMIRGPGFSNQYKGERQQQVPQYDDKGRFIGAYAKTTPIYERVETSPLSAKVYDTQGVLSADQLKQAESMQRAKLGLPDPYEANKVESGLLGEREQALALINNMGKIEAARAKAQGQAADSPVAKAYLKLAPLDAGTITPGYNLGMDIGEQLMQTGRARNAQEAAIRGLQFGQAFDAAWTKLYGNNAAEAAAKDREANPDKYNANYEQAWNDALKAIGEGPKKPANPGPQTNADTGLEDLARLAAQQQKEAEAQTFAAARSNQPQRAPVRGLETLPIDMEPTRQRRTNPLEMLYA